MRITSKGQVTIPQQVREAAGFMPGTDVEFLLDGEGVRVVKADAERRARKKTRGQAAVERFTGSATTPMTSAELMALLRDEH